MSASPQPHLLAVDDEPHALEALQAAFLLAGYENVTCLADSRDVKPFLDRHGADLILLDLDMPHVTGQEILEYCAGACPQVPVIVVTAAVDIATAVHCVKAGAFDYLVKPVDLDRLLTAVCRGLEVADLRRENLAHRRRLATGRLERPGAFTGIAARSQAMQNLLAYADAVAPSAHPVLLLGETGVGKELFARALHQASGRPGAFLALNAAGMDEQMFADTLFGHERGAFTGAERARPGLVEAAANGTLFLDEIGDLSTTSQVKLLRLLQDGDYFPIGADRPRRATARFIFATNSDLERLLAEGRFRKDLYYRLRTHEIRIPPLRERPEDIPLLTDTFIADACRELARQPIETPPELHRILAGYAFPGNARELKGLITDALEQSRGGEFDVETVRVRLATAPRLAPDAGAGSAAVPAGAAEAGGLRFPEPMPTLKEIEDAALAEALRRSGGNQSRAGRLLGLSQPAVSKRLRQQRATD